MGDTAPAVGSADAVDRIVPVVETAPRPGGRARDRWVWLLVVLAIATGSWMYARVLQVPCDDAYIYFTYARSWRDGLGLTFNGVPVQGFTSPLWVAILCLGALTGADIPAMGETASMLAGVAVVFGTYFAARRVGLEPAAAVATTMLVAASGNLAFYMGSGLETVAAAGCTLAVGSRLLGDVEPDQALRDPILAVGLGVAVLARPEMGLLAAVVTLTLWHRTRDVKRAVRFGAVVSAVVLPVVIAARAYYGDWLPNTFHAKSVGLVVNADQGFAYLVTFVRHSPLFVLVWGYVVTRRRAELGPLGDAVTVFVVLYVARVVTQGGDNMVGHRAFVPVLPLMALQIGRGFRALDPRVAIAVAAIIGALNVASFTSPRTRGSSWSISVREHIDGWAEMSRRRELVGRHLAETVKADGLIAVNSAGIIAFHARVPTLDMNGLVDVHIARRGTIDLERPYAHQRGDGRYVLERRPDVIVFGAAGRKEPGESVSDREIAELDWRRWYRPERVAPGVWVQRRR